MSYQVFATKWRPWTLDDIVGQEPIRQALSHALHTQTLHHAYLFTGTRGIGKTTFARNFAKCLSCELGISEKPCNKCKACIGIEQGNFTDLIEIDAASKTRVEDTRELLENVPYLPSVGRFKIYLIDEVHMLSQHSFNALLKTLEEPPPYVKFLLATTEPQKLPPTILSRCLQFHLQPFSSEHIVSYLQSILQKEQINYEVEALQAISQAAGGSLRDALSLVEQTIAHGQGRVSKLAAEEMLGVCSPQTLFDLLEALLEANAHKMLAISQLLIKAQVDFHRVLSDFITLFFHVAILQKIGETARHEIANQKKLLSIATTISPEEVQLYYQIGLQGLQELKWAPTTHIGFEMTLLRMLSFQKAAVVSDEPTSCETESKAESGFITTNEQPPAAGLALAPAIDVAVVPEALKVAVVPQEEEKWHQIVLNLQLNPLELEIAKQCIVQEWSDEKVILQIDVAQKPLLNKRQQQRIEAALSKYVGKNIRLHIVFDDKMLLNTPAKLEACHTQQKHEAAVLAMQQDIHLQALLTRFEASIEKIIVNE